MVCLIEFQSVSHLTTLESSESYIAQFYLIEITHVKGCYSSDSGRGPLGLFRLWKGLVYTIDN